MTAKALVIHHGNCTDGSAAAWCAHRALTASGYDVELYPALHGEYPPMQKVTESAVTFILDFAYKREIMEEMAALTRLQVIDHHASAQKDCEGLPFCLFDMKRSGAGLAWDYFHPGQNRPWFIDYVEDRDLWKWEFGSSKEALLFIDTMPKGLETWNRLLDGEITEIDAISKGGSIRAFIDQYNREVIEQGARFINFVVDGVTYRDIPVVNCTYKNTSDIVSTLAIGHPFALGYFRGKNGKYKYSIRVNDSDFDASALATKLGGGGHRKAAGFSLDAEITEVP